MGNVDFLGFLANLTPGAAYSILILAAGVTALTVAAALLLGQQFARRSPAQRRDIIKLVTALRRSGRRDD